MVVGQFSTQASVGILPPIYVVQGNPLSRTFENKDTRIFWIPGNIVSNSM